MLRLVIAGALMLAACSASAGEVLSDSDLDKVTAGADSAVNWAFVYSGEQTQDANHDAEQKVLLGVHVNQVADQTNSLSMVAVSSSSVQNN